MILVTWRTPMHFVAVPMCTGESFVMSCLKHILIEPGTKLCKWICSIFFSYHCTWQVHIIRCIFDLKIFASSFILSYFSMSQRFRPPRVTSRHIMTHVHAKEIHSLHVVPLPTLAGRQSRTTDLDSKVAATQAKSSEVLRAAGAATNECLAHESLWTFLMYS